DGAFDEAGAAATIRVSVPNLGVQAEGGPSTDPAITADGNLIAFVSEANNLVPGDTNQVADVFLRNRKLGTTKRMSLDAAGHQFVGASTAPAISANGNKLVFQIAATTTMSVSAPGGVIAAPDGSGTDTGGTVTIPFPNQGNGSESGTTDQNTGGETTGDSGVSGNGSTRG